MSELPIHTIESAPERARPLLERARGTFGFLPNLLGKLANAPAALEAYMAVAAAFDKSSLSPLERQVVLLTTSYVNRCPYCVAAHSMIAGLSGADQATITALRNGQPVEDVRLEALRRYTEHLVLQRGQAGDDETRRFIGAGFEKAQSFDVITGITQKTLSNYADHVELLPLDAAFGDQAWTPPEPATARG